MNTLQLLFTTIINMSITATYVALGVIFVRFALRKAPKIFSYSLWSVVLFRLICPLSVTSHFSLLGMLNLNSQSDTSMLKYVPNEIGIVQSPTIQSGISSIDSSANSFFPQAISTTSVNPMQIWMTVLSLIWLTGMAVVFTYSVISYIKMKRRLQMSTLVEDNVYESDRIITAFVCGFVRPKIYVPVNVGDTDLPYILEHERTHIRRRDYIIKPIAFLALILHWFNPFMWLSFALMSRDMEMSCDESVLRRIGKDVRGSYSSSLLSLSVIRNGIFTANPLAFGESHVKARIKNILKYTKPAFGVVIVSIIAVILIGIILVTNPNGNGVDLPLENADNDSSYNNLQNQHSSSDDDKYSRVFLGAPIEDKVCLGLFTTEQAYPESYYMLDEEAQKKLIPLIDNLDKIEKPERIFKGRYYLGINIVYQGLEWQVLSDGSIYHFSSDENGYKEYYAVCKELCEKALQVAERDLGIVPLNPKMIKNIKSAELTVAFSNNKEKVYKQIITDNLALSTIEKLFSEAEVIHGGAGCPFTEGIMTLTLEDGQQIKIAMATDSCCVYFVNGIYFNYKPAEIRGTEDSGISNSIIFDYFNKIPVATRGKDEATNNIHSMPGFTDEEVAAAHAVVEEYFRSIEAKDDEAILKTLTPMHNHSNVVLYGDETRTLTSIDYIEDDPIRKSYVDNGRGSINSTKLENVIAFRVSFYVKYPKGVTGPFNEGDYSDWSMILVRDGKASSWLIDDQGY